MTKEEFEGVWRDAVASVQAAANAEVNMLRQERDFLSAKLEESRGGVRKQRQRAEAAEAEVERVRGLLDAEVAQSRKALDASFSRAEVAEAARDEALAALRECVEELEWRETADRTVARARAVLAKGDR
jgi:chromosome segregation ATPase